METDRTEIIRKRVEKYYKLRGEFIVHLAIYLIINAVLWAMWAFATGLGGFPWPVALTLAWGAGVVSSWLDLRAKRPERFVALERAAQARMAVLYGEDWATLTTEADYQRVFEAVDKAAAERTQFGVHVALYVLINLMLWLFWTVAQSPTEFPFPLAVMAFWGIGLGAHGASVYFSSERQQFAREQAIQREVERLAEQTQAIKKKKRDSARLELGEDGELIEIVEDEWQANEKRLKE